MSQATLDDDDLFDEAASEMREDVESSLAAARETLPAAAAIWDVEADNTLGVLNGLKGALDTGDAAAHVRDAKKWYAVGTEADAFEFVDLGLQVAGVLKGVGLRPDGVPLLGVPDVSGGVAKKWYAVGTEADAFEDAGDLEAEIDELEGIVADVRDAHEQVGDLTATIPELRGALEDAHEAADEE